MMKVASSIGGLPSPGIKRAPEKKLRSDVGAAFESGPFGGSEQAERKQTSATAITNCVYRFIEGNSLK